MRQQVNVTITLDAPIEISKHDIHDGILSAVEALGLNQGVEVFSIDVMEEAEIYGNEEGGRNEKSLT